MNYMLAVNDKQLGICLRMLYAEDLQGYVEVLRTGKSKIVFRVSVDVDDELFKKLNERYEILIS